MYIAAVRFAARGAGNDALKQGGCGRSGFELYDDFIGDRFIAWAFTEIPAGPPRDGGEDDGNEYENNA
jgi:hypothetical protein